MFQRLKRLLPIVLWPFFQLIGLIPTRRFSRLQQFVVFIGYPRSGHTLLGSLLDAHPAVTISIEANALHMVQLGYSRRALLWFITFWSKFVSIVLKNRWSGYSYKVPGGHQGITKHVQIMGDNDANQTSQRFMNDRQLPKALEKRVNIPVKYIHVIRNPFDIITTMHNRKVGNFSRKNMKTDGNSVYPKVLHKKSRGFFRKATQVANLLDQKQLDVLNIYHEDLIQHPERTLLAVLEFLGIQPEAPYLEKSISTIHASSNKSRHTIEWPENSKQEVMHQLASIPFLKEYRG